VKWTDERVANAFFFGLKNTLVAETLDVAKQVAYGATRFRVVTIRGDMIEMTGTMSGGGAPRKGQMSSKPVSEFSEAQISQLKSTV